MQIEHQKKNANIIKKKKENRKRMQIKHQEYNANKSTEKECKIKATGV